MNQLSASRLTGLLLLLLVGCTDDGGNVADGAPADTRSTDALSSDASSIDVPRVGDASLERGTAEGGADGTGTTDCGFDPNLKFNSYGEVWQLASTDGKTCVKLGRHNDSQPGWIYKAIPYTLLEMTVGHEGVMETVTDPSKLDWFSTHHNWNDDATAVGQSVCYRLEVRYEGDPVNDLTYALKGLDLACSTLVWGPVPLDPFNP